MASPELAIAKAAFSAALLRRDPVLPTSCTRDDVDTFHSLFQDVVCQCSPLNVQKCKRWILKNIVPSPARSGALGKYLVAAANSWREGGNGTGDRNEGGLALKERARPTPRRRRLHVLYLLSDVLYHTLRRHPQTDQFARSIRDYLSPLFQSVGAFHDATKHTAKVLDLLAFWEQEKLLDPVTIEDLRAVISKAATTGTGSTQGRDETQASSGTAHEKPSKDVPFTLPATHGDPSMAWFDLPAANWLPHLAPNSTKPMKPDMIKPLQLAAGPADKVVVDAVKTLLSKVDRLWKKGTSWDDDDPHADLNEMGERIILDEITGEIIGGDTYYGWSRQFCEKMRDRQRKGSGFGSRDRSVSSFESRGRSRTRSESPPAHKRRRLSGSYSRSRSRSRSRSKDNSRSRSRGHRGKSTHRRGYSPRGRSRTRSRDYSRSRSRSPRSRTRSRRRHRSPPRRTVRSRTPSPSRTRSMDLHARDYSSRRGGSPLARGNPGLGSVPHPPKQQNPAFQNPAFQNPAFSQPPLYPNMQAPPPPGQQGFMPMPFPPGHVQIPPPPPTNYPGVWPPPPPGMPQAPMAGWNMVPPMPGNMPMPVPPMPMIPPPPHVAQGMPNTWAGGPPQHGTPGQYPYGRGGGNAGYRGGQGGRGRGRGW